MGCVGLTDIECQVLLASQQNTKLLFIIGFYILFAFIWYYFTRNRVAKLKHTYYIMPIEVTKWMAALYFLFTPVHFLLLPSNINFDLALGWFAFFYSPGLIVAFLMPILWVMDKIFNFFGYEGTFEFLKKYKNRLI